MKAIRPCAWSRCGLLLCGVAGAGAGAPPGARPVVVVPITGTVDDGMAHLVERSVAEANSDHARAIVLDVNSPGGLVEAAFRDSRRALLAPRAGRSRTSSERAYSAAALISLSAERIVMAPGASIGAAEPIPAHGARTISALRGEFESTALRNHRDREDRRRDGRQERRPAAV